MGDSSANSTPGMQRVRRYTLTPEEYYDFRDRSLFQINMDTWYRSEYADPNHSATLGTVALGDGPLTAAQGAAVFIARQVSVFLDAFSGVFRPIGVRVGYKPRLTGVVLHPKDVLVPETQKDVQAFQAAVERIADAYEGITSLDIAYEMRATVRDEHGQFAQVWLPYAGEATYSAHYTDGSISNQPKSVAVTYVLTPSAQAGIAPWAVQLHCNYVSLFRADNAEVLSRVRSHWLQWLQTHPIAAERENEYDSEGREEEFEEDYVVTLVVPPPGTPPNNRELSERNTPRLRAAVARWEERLGIPFEWAVRL